MVVFGEDKLDEISVSSETKVCEFKDGEFKNYTICPEDFGIARCGKADIVGGTPEENAAITLAVLRGENGPRRDAVLMNAGAGLYIAGKADTPGEGIRLAAELIDSGRAMKKLKEFVARSNEVA